MKPGTHLCKVIAPANGWFGEAGKNNTPFLRIPLEITSEECEGEETIWQGWLTDASVEGTRKTILKVFGLDMDEDGRWEKLAKLLNSGPFVGKPCEIVCEEEPYEGKTSVKIKWLNAPGSGLGSPMDPDKMLALAHRLQSRNKAAPAQPAAEAPRRLPAAAPRPSADPDLDMADDSVPF